MVKRKLVGFMLVIGMFFGVVMNVNAQEFATVQEVLDEIQLVAETEEEVKEEILELSVNDLNEIDLYLSGKPDITMGEKVILETVKDVMYGGDRLEYALQDNLQGIEYRNSLEEDAKELALSMGKNERNELMDNLKSKENKTEEEQALLKGLWHETNMRELRITYAVLTVVILITVIFTIYVRKNKEKYEGTVLPLISSSLMWSGVIIIVIMVTIWFEETITIIRGLLG